MGGGSLPNTITFQQNPPRVFNDPRGNFPQFTKESFDEWITDISNSGIPGDSGFTDASLNYLVSFDVPWQVIGASVLAYKWNISISNDKSLTEIFDHKDALIDICSSAFSNMNLVGGLDFTGFTSLRTIGEFSFRYNDLNSLILKDLPSLESIEESAFQFNAINKIEINNTALKSIGNFAFSDNSFSDISLIDNIDLSSIGLDAFNQTPGLNNTLTGSLTLRNVPSLKNFPHNAINTGSFEGNLELTGTGFTEIGDFSNGNFTGSLKINDNQDLSTINTNAFRDNSFTSLELSGNPSLTTIEPLSFYENSFSKGVTFTNCPSLQIIGKESFQQSNISGELDFSGLESLTDICNGAFFSNNLNARVKFGNNSKLQILDNNSLQSCKITGLLDLSPLNALTKIGKNTFRDNTINDKVIFENCLSLNLIDERAFDAAGISGEVDFSGIGALTISYEAFIKNPNITQYVFNDNSGTIIGINVDPSMHGVDSSGSGSPPITWDNSGFDISSNGEYIFVKPQVVVS